MSKWMTRVCSEEGCDNGFSVRIYNALAPSKCRECREGR